MPIPNHSNADVLCRFSLEENGLFWIDLRGKRPPEWICGPVNVFATASSTGHDGYGKLFTFETEGGVFLAFISNADLVSRRRSFRALMGLGFRISVSLKRWDLLKEYIWAMDPADRWRYDDYHSGLIQHVAIGSKDAPGRLSENGAEFRLVSTPVTQPREGKLDPRAFALKATSA